MGSREPAAVIHDARREALRRALDSLGARPGPEGPCPYLPERTARHVTVLPSPLSPGVYHAMMDLNFRRMGPVFSRPECEGCSLCQALRVDAGAFRPSRSQRRCRALNSDVMARSGQPRPDAVKLELYRRYLEARHDGQMDGSVQEFEAFLYRSPIETREVEYRLDGRLIAVGLYDVEPDALSAIYCYFDPDQQGRSPGTLNVLWLIGEARRLGIRWVYLGYYVPGSARMSYKASYRPHELLGSDGVWSRPQEPPGS